MKTKIRPPFFEIGVKNYIYGVQVLELAKAADAAAKKYDLDVLFLAPYADIRMITENTDRLIVFAPYMDLLEPGRGMADVLPESIKAAGAKGVVVNHCERPMTLGGIRKTIERARNLGLLSFACANTISEAKAIAQFHPDIINPEPSELIGTGKIGDMAFMHESIAAVKSVYTDILVEQAAGITSGQQVYRYIYEGAEGVGVASGIVAADNPFEKLEEMMRNASDARNALLSGQYAERREVYGI